MNTEEVVMVGGLFVMAGWVLWLLFRKYQLQLEFRMRRLETYNRLIEKFGSASEFIEFAESNSGKKVLLEPLPTAADLQAGIRRFMQVGIVSLVIGVAFWINAAGLKDETDINFVRKAMDLDYWGTLFLALGIGLFLVAGVTRIMGSHNN